MRIGVIGAGQLGRMLAQAGAPLGHEFRFYDSNPNACAQEHGALVCGAFDDLDQLERFASDVDVVTCEFENVPASSLDHLARIIEVRPSATSFRVAQDRLLEKRCFEQCAIGVGPYANVESLDDAQQSVRSMGVPGLLKSRSGGYDGKGQASIDSIEDVEPAWASLGGRPSLYETRVPFTRELSIVGARNVGGVVATYPLVENVHSNGILVATRAPAPDVDDMMRETSAHALESVMRSLDHVGVMAIEFFQADGRLLANEMAPRVHNTGHWTIEGAPVSQFANHVRAICGADPSSAHPDGHTLMLNVLGAFPDRAHIDEIEGVHWHDYAKAPRPGRKVGHVSVCATSEESVLERVRQLATDEALHKAIPGLGVVEELLRVS
ncbi:MAG: 5-(carboxyamino)imidazole ribonucleotide synthase [Phycisphaerales bacterium JB043]